MAAKERQVIVIGTGPAGLTAALYSARANLDTLVFGGPQPGGQLTITTMVENYPGFKDGIMGPDLMIETQKQVERFGAEIVNKTVTAVDLSKPPFLLEVDGEEYSSQALIIASGASAKLLGLDSETRLMGYGVSTCATCDGFFFRDQEIVVVGGGDSAVEEATFLTKFATNVFIVHRRDQLRASKIMQKRAFDNPKIDFMWDSVVEEILGEKEVEGVRLKNVKTNEEIIKDIAGVFMAIGHHPNTDIFQGQIDMDDNGYIITKNNTETNVPGVFAAGDVQDHHYRQAITAAGSGCMASIDAEHYLEALGTSK